MLRSRKAENQAGDVNFGIESLRESARAQADDIPRKLRRLSCFPGKTREGRAPVRR